MPPIASYEFNNFCSFPSKKTKRDGNSKLLQLDIILSLVIPGTMSYHFGEWIFRTFKYISCE